MRTLGKVAEIHRGEEPQFILLEPVGGGESIRIPISCLSVPMTQLLPGDELVVHDENGIMSADRVARRLRGRVSRKNQRVLSVAVEDEHYLPRAETFTIMQLGEVAFAAFEEEQSVLVLKNGMGAPLFLTRYP